MRIIRFSSSKTRNAVIIITPNLYSYPTPTPTITHNYSTISNSSSSSCAFAPILLEILLELLGLINHLLLLIPQLLSLKKTGNTFHFTHTVSTTCTTATVSTILATTIFLLLLLRVRSFLINIVNAFSIRFQNKSPSESVFILLQVQRRSIPVFSIQDRSTNMY